MSAAFRALSAEEQDEVLARLTQIRDERLSVDATQAERCLVSIKRAAERLGRTPTAEEYRQVWRELKGTDQEIENLHTIMRHFGSWREAKEALELDRRGQSARFIEARFARRRLDKVWRYTQETLRSTLERCVADLGHVPQLAEFEHWRRGVLERLRASGDDAAHLPSASPYRRRYGSWEKALLALGYTPDRVAERLEEGVASLVELPPDQAP